MNLQICGIASTSACIEIVLKWSECILQQFFYWLKFPVKIIQMQEYRKCKKNIALQLGKILLSNSAIKLSLLG